MDLEKALTELSDHINSRIASDNLQTAVFELVLVQEVIADIREREKFPVREDWGGFYVR